MVAEALPLRVMMGVGDAIAGKRLVAEGAASKAAQTSGKVDPIRYRKVRFPGSRMGENGDGVDANVDAYREMLPRNDQLLANLAWIRELVVGHSSTEDITVSQLIDITSIGKSIVPLLLHRANNPLDPEGLPATVGDLDKAFQGFFTAAVNLIAISGLKPEDKAPLSERMYRSVDEGPKPKLVTPDKRRGCPAPPPVITDAFSVLLKGTKFNGQEVYSRDNDIERLLDESQLRDFADLYKRFELLKLRSVGKARLIKHREIEIRGQITEDILLGIQQLELYREISEAAEIQVRMNMVLGRDLHGPVIGVEELIF